MDVRAGWSTGGWDGPWAPSEGARRGTQSWALMVGKAEQFLGGSERFYDFRFAILGSEPRGPGVGGNAHV